jgi:hypothetical protein
MPLDRAFAFGFQDADPTPIGDVEQKGTDHSAQGMLVADVGQWIPSIVEGQDIRCEHFRTRVGGVRDIDVRHGLA